MISLVGQRASHNSITNEINWLLYIPDNFLLPIRYVTWVDTILHNLHKLTLKVSNYNMEEMMENLAAIALSSSSCLQYLGTLCFYTRSRDPKRSSYDEKVVELSIQPSKMRSSRQAPRVGSII